MVCVVVFDPVGLSEIADRIGVRRSTAKQWNARGLLPEPDANVSGNPCWKWETIANWAKETGRL